MDVSISLKLQKSLEMFYISSAFLQLIFIYLNLPQKILSIDIAFYIKIKCFVVSNYYPRLLFIVKDFSQWLDRYGWSQVCVTW